MRRIARSATAPSRPHHYTDFEGAAQMMDAVQAGAQYLVTRNVQDYRAGPLLVLQLAELLALL